MIEVIKPYKAKFSSFGAIPLWTEFLEKQVLSFGSLTLERKKPYNLPEEFAVRIEDVESQSSVIRIYGGRQNIITAVCVDKTTPESADDRIPHPHESPLGKKAAVPTETERSTLTEKDVLAIGKKYYSDNKDKLIKKYMGKYIAILNNKVVGANKDFSLLALKIYKKYGYQTIFMPFVDTKEKIVKVPSPRIKII